MASTFLTAHWSNLAMINYEIDPTVLEPFVPRGTELDSWNGHTYASMVGFNFTNTHVKGMAIPFHRDFEEINLRFYVRCKDGGEWKRGVVFIKEIVPKTAIALVARVLYNEPYVAMPTRHSLQLDGNPSNRHVRYEWNHRKRWNSLSVMPDGKPTALTKGSQEEFIAEHYWGYSRQRSGGTVEYEVQHPPWRVWKTSASTIDIDVKELYGEVFADVLAQKPSSAFLAEGSDITVCSGTRI